VRRVILTASGGPFRTASGEAIRTATVEQALKHPIGRGREGHDRFGDLMNKGLELMKRIIFLRFPRPDRRFWSIPSRSSIAWSNSATAPSLRNWEARTCASRSRTASPGPAHRGTGAALDLARARPELRGARSGAFPRLKAWPGRALEAGGRRDVLNAANEVAVAEFLARRLNLRDFGAGRGRLEGALSRNWTQGTESVEEALSVDHNTRCWRGSLFPKCARHLEVWPRRSAGTRRGYRFMNLDFLSGINALGAAYSAT